MFELSSHKKETIFTTGIETLTSTSDSEENKEFQKQLIELNILLHWLPILQSLFCFLSYSGNVKFMQCNNKMQFSSWVGALHSLLDGRRIEFYFINSNFIYVY
jgi:hypothetical protein